MYSHGECNLNNSIEIDTVLHGLNKEGNKSIHILMYFCSLLKALVYFLFGMDFHNLMNLKYFTLYEYL